jgi:hypothetical protein
MMNHSLFGLTLAVLIVTSTFAAEPTVDVAFAIKAGHDYTLAFNDAQKGTIGDQVAARVAKLLDDEFLPYDFLTRPAKHHLAITLEDDPAMPLAPAVVLTLFLDQRRPGLKLVFRTDEMRGEPLGSDAAFVNDVVRIVSSALAASPNDFVGKLLSQINVTADVFMQPSLAVFVLPFRPETYEIGEASRFLVKMTNRNQIPRDFKAEAIGSAPRTTDMPEKFVNGLRLSAEQDVNRALLTSENLSPRAVMMLTYERVRTAAALPPPSSFSVSGGSQ